MPVTTELVNIDKIGESMRQAVRDYARIVVELGGRNSLGLTMFGAVVTPGFDRNNHTARSVLILGRVDLDLLRRLASRGPDLGKSRIAAPLIMTPEYINDSLDTFPLELLEIKDEHVTVLGGDYFAELSFEAGHVRLQCEREIKVALIALRQGLLAAAGREKFLATLEQDAGQALVRTLRGIVWLKGERGSISTAEVLEAAEKAVGGRFEGIRRALDPKGTHGWGEFERLYGDVERLGRVVDEM